MKFFLAFLTCFQMLSLGCVTTSDSETIALQRPFELQFTFLGDDTAIVIPVVFGTNITRNMIFDSGAGLEILSSELADSLGLNADKQYVGRRLTGEEFPILVGKLDSAAIGPLNKIGLHAAAHEYFNGLGKKENVHGLISLNFFKDQVVTIDYPSKKLIIETLDSLKEREKAGVSIPLKSERMIPVSFTTQIDLLVAGQTQLAMVDIGSASSKLPMKFFDVLGLQSSDPKIRKKTYKTMAGIATTTYYAKVPGQISIGASNDFRNGDDEVGFDSNFRMGSIGGNFFLDKIVTFDLKQMRLILAKY
ncbi:MAG: retropepsin-like aspartic protease [Proteobacteria bacterium]|nr:retropepsin-like aspartic protease [Pseudomonadota bacterium]